MLKLLEEKPEAVEVLFNAGLMCIGCGMAQHETLEQGLKFHGFSEKEINKLVERLNGGKRK